MTLNLSNQNLTTLEGFIFPNGLEKLHCGRNRLTSLPSLPLSLIKLTCFDNQLTDLPPLPPSLTRLGCASNQLSSLPPLPPSLITLYCSGNRLTSLPPLPPPLTKLYCSRNNLTSLPPLPPSLCELYCATNKLTSLPPLPPTLSELYCPGNNFPPHYYDNGQMKSIEELRDIILVDRLRRACSIVHRLVADRAARNIQRVWKRYWLEPYHNTQLGYPVSRYLLHYQHQL